MVPIGGDGFAPRYRLDRLLAWDARRQAAMTGPNRQRQKSYRVLADRKVKITSLVDDLLSRKPR